MQVQSLGRKDALEKEMATHSSILAWKTSWSESMEVCSPRGPEESDTTEQLNHHLLPRSRIGWLVTEVIRLRIVNSFLEEPNLFLKIESSR